MSPPPPPLSHRLRTAAGLSPGEWARALEAAVLFHGFRVVLRVVPIRRLRGVLGPEGPRDAPLAAPPHRPDPAVFAVARALRRVAKPHAATCLPQALAGRVMLRRRGLPSTLSLGARPDPDGPGAFAFHAWLRSGGVVLNVGGGPRRHAVLATYHDPPAAAQRADRETT